jgi:ATP-dependent Clp protease ATP-binding subunit ClpC
MRNRFTRDVKEILSYSAEEAIRTKAACISGRHLLLGMIKQAHNNALTLLEEFGLSLPELGKEVEEGLVPEKEGSRGGAERLGVGSWRLPLDREAERSIRGSVKEARKMGSKEVDAEHLLLAMVRDTDNGLHGIFQRLNIDYAGLAAILTCFTLSSKFKDPGMGFS